MKRSKIYEFYIIRNKSHKRSASRRITGGHSAGFTLIELLMVIFVVTVLSGILMPALVRTRAASKSVMCKNKLRQWGLALYFYMDEHDGSIPRRGQGVQPISMIERPEDWFNCLSPYIGEKPYKELAASGCQPQPGDKSIFVCPSASSDSKLYFFPYAMNMYLSPWIRPENHKLSEIPCPEHLVFMADAPGPYSSTVPSKKEYSVAARHEDRANLVFLDGHIGNYSGEYLGCGAGDTGHRDVQWQTGSTGVNQSLVE
ncbi:MAG: prepilin-type N-terminal cleavage/methylation domain-containing protein [Sedimentisphaerales bacterium]|nr:prepilin-type N-terminal cleavage/methylation domain-containing protein [Sedimentisphaerales bacterium]